jgi:hypothetical protein
VTLKLQRFGDKAVGVRITGDPRNTEVETFRIAFPWGDVEVVRANEDAVPPEYWVHVRVNREALGHNPPGEVPDGKIIDARLDILGRSTGDVSIGDFGSPDLYHLAVRLGPSVSP